MVATREAERRARAGRDWRPRSSTSRRCRATCTICPACSPLSRICGVESMTRRCVPPTPPDTADSTSMASLADLVREHTSLDREQVEPSQPTDVGVGAPRRLLLRRPAALRAREGRALVDRRPGPPGDRADRVPHRLGRHVRQRHRADAPQLSRRRRARSPRATSPSRRRPTRRACSPSRCAAAAARSRC